MKLKSVIVSLALVIVSVFAPVSAQAYELTGVEVNSKHAVFASLDTGEIMYEKASEEKAFPASLTKVMTAIVVLENCPDVEQLLTVPKSAITSLLGTGTAVGGLKEGEEISVRHLLEMMLVSSAADAANTLAEYYGGGDIDKFVSMMNAKAKELKMDSTNFMNPHGLHDENHYSTASDLYKMAVYAYQMPIMMEICEQYIVKIPATNLSGERTMVTTNQLINPTSVCYYKYARGIKTGFTTPAGRCLITTASKDGYNYICVLMGAENANYIADRKEFADAKNLFEWAFVNFEHRKVVDKSTLISEIPLKFSWDADFLQLYPEKNVYAIVPKNIEDDSLTYDAVFGGDYINAPVKSGEIIGYARIICAGKEVGTVNLIATEDVSLNPLMFFKQVVDELFATVIFKVLLCAIGVTIIVLIVVTVMYNKKRQTRARKINKIRRI